MVYGKGMQTSNIPVVEMGRVIRLSPEIQLPLFLHLHLAWIPDSHRVIGHKNPKNTALSY